MMTNWNIHVGAKNVEFRILITGEGSSAYDRDWKGAHVSFSSSTDGQMHVMTVSYLYGKRIDIMLDQDLSSYQVQEDVNRITLTSNKRRATFSIRSVARSDALLIKKFLQNVIEVRKKTVSPVRRAVPDDGKAISNLHVQSSPLTAARVLPPSGRMCYSDSKPKPNGQLTALGKRLRSSSSPVRLCVTSDDEKVEKTSGRKSTLQSKKFQDFRKAQADVRRTIDLGDDGKENASPVALKRPNSDASLNKSTFYGNKDDGTFFSSQKKSYQLSRPSRKSSRIPLGLNPHYHSTGSVVRSLLTETSQNQSKSEDLGIRKLPESNLDDLSMEVTWGKQSPLSEKGNVISSTSSQRGGFQNLGNTCYMNSTLQSLFGLISFQKDLQAIGGKIKPHLQSNSVLGALTNLMKQKSAFPSQKSALLKAVKQAISSNAKQFHGFAQQDAHEFVRLCLDLIQEEIVKINKKIESDSTSTKENDQNDLVVIPLHPPEKDDDPIPCPVAENFAFTVKNEIVCSNCNKTSCREEQLYDLPVELRQGRIRSETICLQKLVNLTFLDERVEYECDSCKHKKATVRKYVTKLPRIMMIYLKRYSYNSRFEQSEKLRQRVSIPRYITFCKQCASEVQCNSSETFKFFEPSDKAKPAKCDEEILSDKELEKCFENVDNFDAISSTKVSSPFQPTNVVDGNNNNDNTRLRAEGVVLATGSSGYFSHEADKFTPESSQLLRDYAEISPFQPMDQERLQNMSEEDQILLAMQLSMQDSLSTSQISSPIKVTPENPANPITTPTSMDTLCNFSPISNRKRWRDISPNPFETNLNDSVHTSNEAVNNSSGSHCPNSSSSRESNGQPDLAHSCPSLSSIQLLGDHYAPHDRVDALVPSSVVIDASSDGAGSFKRESSSSELGDDEKDNDEDSHELFKNQSTGHLPHSYHIVSIVSHKGGSSKHGHYVSDVMTNYESNQWQCFDDDYVETLSEESVLLGRQRTCYLLFYVHK